MPPEITLVGLGPGPLACLTREALDALLQADRVLLRMSVDPILKWLDGHDKRYFTFDRIYGHPGITSDDLYGFIADAVIQEARRTGHATYAVPGHPFVLETPSSFIAERAEAGGLLIRVVPGLSYLEVAFGLLRLGPNERLHVCSSWDIRAGCDVPTDVGLFVNQAFATPLPHHPGQTSNLVPVAAWLETRYPSAHPVSVIATHGPPEFETAIVTLPLRRLVADCPDKGYGTLYVPPLPR